MIGKSSFDGRAHCPFGGTIGLGDRIVMVTILALNCQASVQRIANGLAREGRQYVKKCAIHF